ncbi:LytR C-terminal domain-containing protein [Rugamonas apoptosis]|uniref:Tetratricopeptide repeat protein n=1 Tax=Rugamonas apoptosis TaxID=2758570 RepID=A0A7W2F6W4_9BURK|nr:LytR C-terminal domain-containing protein [Rugamonas apoptosis]MBA5686227.1 tetratricopeptide repeat protein [Rugamonas apoptosis]
MSNLKPIVIAVAGAVMLSACGGPAVRQSLQVQGVQRVSQSTEQSAASWYRLGKYHQERGQISLALGAYAQSLALDAGQLDARNAVATIDAQQGRLADARDALRRLVDDYPGEAQPLNNLGYVYYLMGDYSAAIATLQRAVAIEPNGRAYYNLVQAQTAARDGAPASALAAAAAPATIPAAPVAPAANVAPSVPSRMELVQLAPQVLELKLRPSQSIAALPALPAAAPVNVPPVQVIAPVVAAAPAPAAKPVAVAAAPVAAAVQPIAMAAPAKVDVSKPVAVVALATPAMVAKPVAAAPAPMPAMAAKPAEVTAAPAPVTPVKPVAVAALAAPAVVAQPVAMTAPAKPVAATPEVALAAAAVPATATPRLEISNGNGVTGLAKRYRSVLGKLGILASRLSNARPFRQQASIIEYRPGFAAQAASLQKALPGRTALQQSDALTRADVRLLLGKDAPAQLAQAEQLQAGARFAAVDTTH